MFLRRSLPGAIGLLLALSTAGFAQQPQDPTPNREGRPGRTWEGKGHRRNKMARHGFGKLSRMRELNLTEEQRQQHRAIMERHLESIKAQREELFKLREKRIAGTFTADDEARAKALRQEIHNSMQSSQTEIANILTPEQRTKLEEFKAERKARHSEMRTRRRERLNDIPQQ